MKMILNTILAVWLSSLPSFAIAFDPGSELRMSRTVAALSACESRSLKIELNVDNRTSKVEMVEIIKVFADYSSFAIVPIHSEQNTVAFRATLDDRCVSDSCAKALGWFSLQHRLSRFNGVAISCDLSPSTDSREPGRPVPMPAPRMPAPGAGQKPPIPGAGGVTGGN